ncbi:MAG: hypothetical protein ACM3MG_10610 [Bacillota bacterium]
MKQALLIFAFILAPMASFAVTCPLGPKETTLTVQRVMINFGRYYADFDDLAYKARNPNESITDNDMQRTIENLEVAIACADEVIKNPTPDSLPSKLSTIQDEAQRKDLIDSYLYFMEDFKEGLMECRQLVQTVLAQNPTERNYSLFIEKSNEMNERIDHAHSKL